MAVRFIKMSVSPITTYLDVLSISFTFTTLFFGSDAAANPGPETQVSEVSFFLFEQLKY
jgi:hypothetical protein